MKQIFDAIDNANKQADDRLTALYEKGEISHEELKNGRIKALLYWQELGRLALEMESIGRKKEV